MLGPTSKSMVWRKSSYSGSGEHCVELGRGREMRGIRDSKLGDESPELRMTPREYGALLTHVRGIEHPR